MHRAWSLALVWGAVVSVMAETTTTPLPPCDVNGTATHDVTLRNGSTFEMTCSLTRWPDGELFDMGMLRSRDAVVPASQIRRLNATSATWTKPDVQTSDSGTYYCSVKGSACESVFSATALLVGYAPLEPFGEGCSGDNFETFQCHWRTRAHRISTKHQVFLRVGTSNVSSLISCNTTVDVAPQDLTCRLTTWGKTIYRIEEPVLHFLVNVTNAYGTSSWTYAVDHFANVKLAAPSFLQCNSGTDKISISWTSLPEISTFPDVQYEVRLEYGPDVELVKTVNNTDEVLVTNLTPNILYNVSVRAKFAKASSELWSQYSDGLWCKTAKARPTALPKVTENGFMIQDFQDTRKVRLFYQRVPRSLWNGDKMTYVLHWCSSRGECASHKVDGERSHVDLFNLSRVESYTFQLFSENEMGRSLRSVNVLLPSSDRMMPSVQDAYVNEVQILNPRFSLAPRTLSDEVLHYTLFWCSSVGGDADSCAEDVSWATVKSSGDAWSATTCAMAGLCKYGVATRSAEAVSAMTWIDCVQPKSREYQDILGGEDRMYYDEIADTSVQIKFLTKCGGLVATRVIRYCALRGLDDDPLGNSTVPESELEECTNIAVGPEKTVRLQNLYPETTYQVTITTVLGDSMTIRRRPVRIRTQGRGPTALATAALVVAALLVALTVIAAVFWRRISVYVEEYKNTTVKVLIPAEFAKEPIKKSDSVRSNLREYVLANKESPFGIPHVLRSQKLEGQADEVLSPEVDCLLKDPNPGIPFLPELTFLSGDKYLDEPTQQTPLVNALSPGYSMVSSLQDKGAETNGNAYSKFLALQDHGATQRPPVARGYSLFSSFALNNPDTNSAIKEPMATEGTPGYSKIAPFLMGAGLGSTQPSDRRWKGQPCGEHKRFSVSDEMPPSYVRVASEVPNESHEHAEGFSSQPQESDGNVPFPLPKDKRPPGVQIEFDKRQPYVQVGFEMTPHLKNGTSETKEDCHQQHSSDLKEVSDAYVKVGCDVQRAVSTEALEPYASAIQNTLPLLRQEQSYVEAGHDIPFPEREKQRDGGLKSAAHIPTPITEGSCNAYVKVGYDVTPSNDNKKLGYVAAPYCQLGAASSSDPPFVYSKVGLKVQEHNGLPAWSADAMDMPILQEPPLHPIISNNECQRDLTDDIAISEKGTLTPLLDFSSLGGSNFLGAEFIDHGVENSKDSGRYHPGEGYTTWAALAKTA